MKLIKKTQETYQHCSGSRTHDLIINDNVYSCFVIDNLYNVDKVIGISIDYPTEAEKEKLEKYAFKINLDDRFDGRYWFYIDANKINY